MTKIEKTKYFKELNFSNPYNSYEEFYSKHKTEIYEAIISVFEEFSKSDKKLLTIKLDVTLSGVHWSNELSFIPEHYFVLKRDIIPYFEELEDYEMCDRILRINNNIVTHQNLVEKI